jgi:hypothetical protein
MVESTCTKGAEVEMLNETINKLGICMTALELILELGNDCPIAEAFDCMDEMHGVAAMALLDIKNGTTHLESHCRRKEKANDD